ncbi:MAG: hypothetical protein V6Z89_13910 [Desulfobacter sp.]
MKIAKIVLPLFVAFSLVQPINLFGEIKPDQFTNADGVLTENELIEFFLVHYKITYQDVFTQKVPKPFTNAEGNIQQAKKKFSVMDKLTEMEIKYGIPPYEPIMVYAYIKNKTVKQIRREEAQAFGAESQPEKKYWTYGPIKIRDKFEDWNSDIKGVKGSTLAYSDNREKDNSTWATKGNLIFPIQFFKEGDGADSEYNYAESALLPSIKWNYFDLNGGGGNDSESLTFQLPWYTRFSHKIVPVIDQDSGLPVGLASWASEFYITTIYNTDFDHDGEIVGTSFTYEPIIRVGQNFQTGSWLSLPTIRPPIGYLFRFIPGGIYSHVLSEGPYIKREENDDALGVTTSMELRIKPFGLNSPWEFRTDYELFHDFTGGDDGYFDKWEIALNYWFNDYVALSLEHQNGDDFLTKDEVDLITVGFQVRQ